MPVKLSFEEVTSSKTIGLSTVLEAPQTSPKVAGWNQCYQKEDGTEVWNANADVPTSAYGKNANAYYRVFRVVAKFTPSAVQKASTFTNHVIDGKVAIADNCDGTNDTANHNCAKFWVADETVADTSPINTDGKSTVPAVANLTADAKDFTEIDITANQNSWIAGSENTVKSTTYVAVMVDGEVHGTNTSVTATLSFSNVTPANNP